MLLKNLATTPGKEAGFFRCLPAPPHNPNPSFQGKGVPTWTHWLATSVPGPINLIAKTSKFQCGPCVRLFYGNLPFRTAGNFLSWFKHNPVHIKFSPHQVKGEASVCGQCILHVPEVWFANFPHLLFLSLQLYLKLLKVRDKAMPFLFLPVGRAGCLQHGSCSINIWLADEGMMW